jgi:serine protease inhibitor
MRQMFAMILALVMLTGCVPGASTAALIPAAPGPAAKTASPALMQGQAEFGFKLYQQMRQARPGENLIISPVSIAMILQLTMDGARGETRDAMAKALSVSSLSPEQLHRANADLRSMLADPDPKVKLTVANAVWYDQTLTINRDFGQTAADSFGAEIRAVAPADAVSAVNRWVEKATNKKIKQILSPGDQGVMYLVNALYFLGTWSDPFKEADTEDAPFTRLDGTQKQHPLMYRHAKFDYLQGDKFQAVRLPYGKEQQLSMYVFLPDPGSSLPAFEQTLTADRWAQWMTAFKRQDGTLQMPRVKSESSAELKDALVALGMGVAFDDTRADFGGLFANTVPGLAIAKVKHKTFLEINEKGTEAAAATAVVVGATAVPPSGQPFTMIVNRPFFLAIRDDRSGAILFMGSIVDP